MTVRIEEREVIKTGDAARLAGEAAVLGALRHPGVVELLGQGPGELRLTLVDGPTLTTARSLELHEVAGVTAAIAEIVADMHQAGAAHGALEPDHVLLGADGGPVLCGFGQARPLSSGVDHPGAPGDVKALGEMLTLLLPAAIPKGMTRPHNALRTLARVATHPNPDRRPTARELADAIADEVHGARLPAMPAGPGAGSESESESASTAPGLTATGGDPLDRLRSSSPDDDEPRRARRAAMVAALILVGSGAVVLASPHHRSAAAPLPVARKVASTSHASDTSAPAPGAGAGAPTAATSATSATSAASGTRSAADGSCPVVTGPLRADVDGDGCDEALSYADGVLRAGVARFAVGKAGDVVASGSWGCAPTATLALLRPSTGDVFAFSGWGGTDQRPVAAPLVTRVTGATALAARDADGDGCDDLVVSRSGGAPVIVHPRSAA